jgi:transcriptional antiterminator NusG
MCPKDEQEKWYALFVVTGEEEKVKERLQYRLMGKDIRILVPKRKLRERRKGIWETKLRVIFPGYVLINGIIGIEEYYVLVGVPGLIAMLKDKSGLLEIHEHEIHIINKLMGNSEIIETSSVMFDGPRIIVVDGPLKGLEGLIEEVDKRKGRAKVRLNLIGAPRVVDLSISMIQTA